jgi:hypothetical protein
MDAITVTLAALQQCPDCAHVCEGISSQLYIAQDSPLSFRVICRFWGWPTAAQCLDALTGDQRRAALHYTADVCMTYRYLAPGDVNAISLTRDYAEGRAPLFRVAHAWRCNTLLAPFEVDGYYSTISSALAYVWSVAGQSRAYRDAYAEHLLHYCRAGRRPAGSLALLRQRIAANKSKENRA